MNTCVDGWVQVRPIKQEAHRIQTIEYLQYLNYLDEFNGMYYKMIHKHSMLMKSITIHGA